MATSLGDLNDAPRPQGGHQRSKSSVLKSLMHRRNQSDGSYLPSALSIATNPADPSHLNQHLYSLESPTAMGFPRSAAGALGELQQNQQDAAGSRSPRKSRDESRGGSREERGRSPTKSAFTTLTRMAMKDSSKISKSREPSPEKPKKTKSSTNLAGLLSRPKSFKSLNKQAKEDEARAMKDKENRTPPASTTTMDLGGLGGPPPPIYAQFSSGDLGRQQVNGRSSFDIGSANGSRGTDDGIQMPVRATKARPWSFQSHKMEPEVRSRDVSQPDVAGKKHNMNDHKPAFSERISSKAQRPKLFTAFSSTEQRRGHSSPKNPADRTIDPKDINAHLEAMLDRRNIPENQRFKMRNLNDTIKMEFIRQDWAEMAAKGEQNGNDNRASIEASSSAVAAGTDNEESHPKRTRGRSFTLGRAKKESKSPSKKSRGEGTLGRHFRTKSTESFVGERPTSAGSSTSNGILSKIKLGQGPGDFVSYLRKVRKPEMVEVGKLHKLRLLLRNETVSWAEDFIRQGGMEEIVGLLYRILEVEWREEHEDALLHEDLLCLKALCTTSLALQYLDSIQSDLLPRLIHTIFDPEKKGPSEFTTRNIITSLIFTYIETATPQERVIRSKTVLSYLRNPEPKEEERPVPFVLEMRKERPYTVWNKEVVSVTKEVFWIFLHHLNVIALPAEMSSKGGMLLDNVPSNNPGEQPFAYMQRHFPRPRPPVPAAPYVGGVEWDATNYLASHLDLVNAIIACTPAAEQRNALRHDLRISGWERCLGGSLRLCKEKFYGCVHEALRTWVAAAAEDGWDVREVRYGPPADSSRSPRKKTGGGQKPGGGNGAQEAAPRIEMPRLDFGLSTPNHEQHQQQKNGGDAWLS
ncbi:hypothetical protein SODALDRAFT_380904 [Sodiomyces alkalinus F11]|uniref:Formin GTPase-binding domain-containing protein n=1 Tax=Sodiomyces alkalinus (strain CBS 110278 / VKM F-3762 / F11) TaxID=1314773 RepID=A0A3N2PQ93_SODAK|nr:hypothetical protein SODALDRAFT_380904 [Sodiomyces alkalinus F11]ROT36600.1 hypothetical protein SODALDRAFT_380904 [Sodiomyces alkalinus F11]